MKPLRHTPAPWYVSGTITQPDALRIVAEAEQGNTMITVAAIHGMTEGDPQAACTRHCNIDLIVRAPNMYQALRAIANMRIDEATKPAELAALCSAIARSEIAKIDREDDAQP